MVPTKQVVAPSPETKGQAIVKWATFVLFAISVAVNLVQVTSNLDTGHFAGHEFRQSQTALSVHFIQREQNFDLAYPTPVFGPPWSIPMEFPLYQWATASLAGLTDSSIPRTGRVISIFAFYLGLPAAFILLRRFGATLETTLRALSLILLAPIYIQFTRAVLIESTALCLSLWFLVCFEWMRLHGSWWAIGATVILGALAAVVKVTTFTVWGGIAVGLGVCEIVRRMKKGDRSPVLRFSAKAALAGLVPLFSGIAWINYSDRVKADSPGGFFSLLKTSAPSISAASLTELISIFGIRSCTIPLKGIYFGSAGFFFFRRGFGPPPTGDHVPRPR